MAQRPDGRPGRGYSPREVDRDSYQRSSTITFCRDRRQLRQMAAKVAHACAGRRSGRHDMSCLRKNKEKNRSERPATTAAARLRRRALQLICAPLRICCEKDRLAVISHSLAERERGLFELGVAR